MITTEHGDGAEGLKDCLQWVMFQARAANCTVWVMCANVQAYGPVLAAIQAYVLVPLAREAWRPNTTQQERQARRRVLVPGAGLGRLALDIHRLGYDFFFFYLI